MGKVEVRIEQEKLLNQIYERAEEQYGKKPITDGIINIDEYFDAKARILWILKEAHSDKGDYFIGDRFNNRDFITNPEKSLMYKNMTYINYSLQNGNIKYKDLPSIKEHYEIEESFRKIGYVNIEKVPGKSQSYDADMIKSTKVWIDILLKQIELCRADIVIFGGTYKYLRSYLNIDEADFSKSDYTRYIKQDGCIYIDAKHPACIMEEGEYCADIIDLIISNSTKA